MLNNVSIVGYITKDPELKKTQNNKSVVNFTLGVRVVVGKDEEPHTNWIPCVAWGRDADFLDQYVKKGTLLGIEGFLQSGSYEKDGNTLYTLVINCRRVFKYNPQAMPTNPNVSVENDPIANWIDPNDN